MKELPSNSDAGLQESSTTGCRPRLGRSDADDGQFSEVGVPMLTFVETTAASELGGYGSRSGMPLVNHAIAPRPTMTPKTARISSATSVLTFWLPGHLGFAMPGYASCDAGA